MTSAGDWLEGWSSSMRLEVATSDSYLTRENDGSVSLNDVRYTRSVALGLDAAIIRAFHLLYSLTAVE